ncbi:MAG: class D beta-lactamase [Candidatus Kapaibacterium sp.]
MFGKFFADANVEGTFLLYNPQENQYLVWNPERARTPYLPASTFKIFNSLVALETGVIKDENDTISWDGVKRQIPDWNRTHDLRSAIAYSVVWYYQELARRIGEERMQHYIDTANYGNRDISGGIDRFWLDGGLRITPQQQIDFLVRLHNNTLPFSQRTMNIVKDIMILKETPDYVYRGKTGWVLRDTTSVGWFVGYLQRGEKVWFFATNIRMEGDKDVPKRKEITWNILKSLGLVEGEEG